MRRTTLAVFLVALLSLTGCPTDTTRCTPQSCANGCCSPDGTCVPTDTNNAQCGLNGGMCSACSATQQCSSGACVTAVGLDAGSNADAGATDAGRVDAGPSCADVPHDPVFGTLHFVIYDGGSPVGSGDWANLPANVVYVTQTNTGRYAVTSTGAVGTLDITDHDGGFRPIAGRVMPTDAGGFLTSALAVAGNTIMGGYTTSFTAGTVSLVSVLDGGVQTVDAPGFFSGTALSSSSFLVNSTGLGSVMEGPGIYSLDSATLTTRLAARFDPAWMASSGYTSSTSAGWLLGYFHGTEFSNYVRVVPRAALAQPDGGAYPLAQAPIVASGSNLLDLTASGFAAIAVHGAFSSDFTSSWTTDVERIYLTPSNDGGVTVGPRRLLLQSNDRCTSVVFASQALAGFALGLKDKNGRRVVFFGDQPAP